jgi:hypothetical protein
VDIGPVAALRAKASESAGVAGGATIRFTLVVNALLAVGLAALFVVVLAPLLAASGASGFSASAISR